MPVHTIIWRLRPQAGGAVFTSLTVNGACPYDKLATLLPGWRPQSSTATFLRDVVCAALTVEGADLIISPVYRLTSFLNAWPYDKLMALSPRPRFWILTLGLCPRLDVVRPDATRHLVSKPEAHSSLKTPGPFYGIQSARSLCMRGYKALTGAAGVFVAVRNAYHEGLARPHPFPGRRRPHSWNH